MRLLVQTILLRTRNIYIVFEKLSSIYCFNKFEFNNKRFLDLIL
jgi:hypothetical protein